MAVSEEGTAVLRDLKKNQHADTPAVLRARIAELECTVRKLESDLSARQRGFFDNPVPSIIYIPASFEILEANESALALYGYTPQQIRSRMLMDLFASESHRDHPELLTELRKPVNAIGPFAHRGASGQELIVSMVFFSYGVNGMDARMLMIQDETARHTAEEALRAEEERYRELFENANDVIFLHDLQGNI
ncbi:MAG: PAS domain S-box protein, partial [Bryobacteraceae bacterium]